MYRIEATDNTRPVQDNGDMEGYNMWDIGFSAGHWWVGWVFFWLLSFRFINEPPDSKTMKMTMAPNVHQVTHVVPSPPTT